MNVLKRLFANVPAAACEQSDKRSSLRYVRPGTLRPPLLFWLVLVSLLAGCADQRAQEQDTLTAQGLREGKAIFRFDTFGNEPHWTDTLQMHRVIQESVDPLTALKVGLKVDSEALPPGLLAEVDLTDPATTVALLRLDAVVGLKGTFDEEDNLVAIGTTCALCHSSVDNSVLPGIGKRLDGWPNQELNVGAILALSPALPDAMKAILRTWGPSNYDPRFFTINRTNGLGPTQIPPAYGQQGIKLQTWTGAGDIRYWNNYVAVTQMRGQGVFVDPRIPASVVHEGHNLVQPKLRSLEQYQLSLLPPSPPEGSFDTTAAERGEQLFNTKAECATCHIPPLYTDANSTLHRPEETGMNPFVAERSVTGKYRTTPLRGVWHTAPYFHDGSAATLRDVVEHYDGVLGLALTKKEVDDLVEFLKSL